MALVLPNLTLGGAERQAIELARRLPAAGWTPILIAAEEQGPLIDTIRAEGLRLYCIDAEFARPKRSPGFWLNAAACVRRIAAICRHERVAVVQSFLFWQNVLVAPAARFAPTVRGVIAGRRNLGNYKDARPHYQWIEDRANAMTDVIVCNSRAVENDVRRRERLGRARLKVVPNGIDAAHFESAARADLAVACGRLKDATFVVGTVGNLKPQKRHDRFLRIVAAARGRIPGLKGVIVGRDLGEWAALERLSQELGIAGDVYFVGGVDDPAPWMKAMDAFLLTSDWEGMPNVVLEAMAAGTPVIAAPVGGTAEIIEDGRNGFLAGAEDIDGFVAHLEALRSRPDLRMEIAAAARATVRNHFSMEAMVEEYRKIYEGFL